MYRHVVIFAKKVISHEVRVLLRKLNWRLRYLLQVAVTWADPATDVYCPIADRSFRTFIHSGNDLLSPLNGAKKRQRLVWLYLKNELQILSKPMTLLHVAPEQPYLEILRKQEHIDYRPVDKMVDGYSNQKGVRNMDLTNLEFEDSRFDCVICNHVLEHIPDDTSAISEMYRVLKQGGVAVVTVPIDENREITYESAGITSPKERVKHFGQWDHVRWYAPDIKERFENAGFDVDLNRYGLHFSEEEYRKYGLCDDLIVVATKKNRV